MVFICSSHQRSIAALTSSERSRLCTEWMDMAELNSRCCLWRDAVPLAGCAADVALLEAKLQAAGLLARSSAASDSGRAFARALAMLIVANITLWEAYDHMNLSEKSCAITSGVEQAIRQLLAAWFFLPVDLCERLLAYFQRETIGQSDRKDGAGTFRDDNDLKSVQLRQSELACLLHPLTAQIGMMYRAEQVYPRQHLPC